MSGGRRLAAAVAAGVVLVAAGAVLDLVGGAYWARHALLASLVANLVVVIVVVAVVNEVLERRDRRRWSLLAQSVLFDLIQSARATWTAIVEELGLADVASGATRPLRAAAAAARDPERLSAAVWELLRDGASRGRLLELSARLGEHATDVIAKWAPVMVSARPYAEVLDRHVELAGRLEWLASGLAHDEPLPETDGHDRALTRARVASERSEELGSDEWLHDQILAVLRLAMELDHESRKQAFGLVPLSWWQERTTGLATEEALPPPVG
jgi:hypothetical protein